jgi:hypothetical protein
MAEGIQIQCVNKSGRADPAARIDYIGGSNPDGTRWRLSEENAIAARKAEKWRFWTFDRGKPVPVVVARSTHGREYLKTNLDWVIPDSLLSLPECP